MLTVITGPPCSGKTTYLRNHAQPGHVVIDFDDLAQAFGSPVRHGHVKAYRAVTVAAREAAIEAAVKQHQAGETVWIVDGTIPAGRQRLYDDARAVIVALTATPAELHARADRERPELWHHLIDKWGQRKAQAPEMPKPAPTSCPACKRPYVVFCA